ncbi:cyclin-O protein B-like [Xenopus laevis]|uniref:Cyclin-O protein B-like n=1 Tax=Xenopus laevis TaxID=8355 RepID=A0A8J1LJM4_XENLA|nr:cyclin-O protein B-like [Xenopus laevis]
MGISNPKKRKREERSRGSAKKNRDERVTCQPAAEEPVPIQDQWNTLRNIDGELDIFEDYGEESYLFYKALEEKFQTSGILTKQTTIAESDWREIITILIKVHRHFSLDFSTLCLAVKYMARYISGRQLKPGILKPVGATSLYLAIKIMEDNPPNAEEFLEVFGETLYSPRVLAFVEDMMLYRLECRLHQPTVDFFLEHFTLMSVSVEMFFYDNITRVANALTAARGIAALTMMKYEFHTYLPSLMAQCCLKAAEHILGYNLLVELPSDHPSQIVQKCLRKTLLLASANKEFLQQLMPGVFPEVFPKFPPPTIQRGRTGAKEPARQPREELRAKEPVKKPSKTSAKRPNKETGAKEPASQSNKLAKRPKIEASVNDPKDRAESTAAEAVAATRRTARNTQRCCKFCNGTRANTYPHTHTDTH